MGDLRNKKLGTRYVRTYVRASERVVRERLYADVSEMRTKPANYNTHYRRGGNGRPRWLAQLQDYSNVNGLMRKKGMYFMQ